MRVPSLRFAVAMILILFGGRDVNAGSDLFGIGIDANVAVGLDPATRKLIEALPENVRKQAYGLLKDSLELLKTDIDEYLKTINSIVDQQINHAQCAANGAVANSLDQIWHQVGMEASPFTDLNEERLKAIGPLGPYNKPEAYRIQYLNLNYRAALTYCKVELSPPLKREVWEYEESYLKLAYMWERLEGYCNDVQDCYAVLDKETHTLLDRSESRDIDRVNGWTEYQQIVRKPPTKPSWRESNGFSKFDPSQYEAAMTHLFLIGDKVCLAKVQRLWKAKELIAAAEDQLAAASTEIAAAHADLVPKVVGIVHSVSPDQIHSANAHASTAKGKCDQSRRNAKAATDLDPGVNAKAIQVNASCKGIKDYIAAVRVAAPWTLLQ